jgi:hypothetical protein
VAKQPGELDIDVLIARVEAQAEQLLTMSRELSGVVAELRRRRAEGGDRKDE